MAAFPTTGYFDLETGEPAPSPRPSTSSEGNRADEEDILSLWAEQDDDDRSLFGSEHGSLWGDDTPEVTEGTTEPVDHPKEPPVTTGFATDDDDDPREPSVEELEALLDEELGVNWEQELAPATAAAVAPELVPEPSPKPMPTEPVDHPKEPPVKTGFATDDDDNLREPSVEELEALLEEELGVNWEQELAPATAADAAPELVPEPSPKPTPETPLTTKPNPKTPSSPSKAQARKRKAVALESKETTSERAKRNKLEELEMTKTRSNSVLREIMSPTMHNPRGHTFWRGLSRPRRRHVSQGDDASSCATVQSENPRGHSEDSAIYVRDEDNPAPALAVTEASAQVSGSFAMPVQAPLLTAAPVPATPQTPLQVLVPAPPLPVTARPAVPVPMPVQTPPQLLAQSPQQQVPAGIPAPYPEDPTIEFSMGLSIPDPSPRLIEKETRHLFQFRKPGFLAHYTQFFDESQIPQVVWDGMWKMCEEDANETIRANSEELDNLIRSGRGPENASDAELAACMSMSRLRVEEMRYLLQQGIPQLEAMYGGPRGIPAEILESWKDVWRQEAKITAGLIRENIPSIDASAHQSRWSPEQIREVKQHLASWARQQARKCMTMAAPMC